MSLSSNQVARALPVQTKLQNGAYVIGPVLGQGGFGITYWGGDARLGRYVAIKEFFPSEGSVRYGQNVQLNSTFSVRDFETLKAQFIKEARALAQFRHPNIVHVFTYFEENNTAYMVMEFLKGKSLLKLVKEGPLSEEKALNYIEKVADALKVVHNAKMLHRDVNPSNIIVCDDERVVLIDFGLTKNIEAPTFGLGTRRLSQTASFGTEGYAPPEQYVRAANLGTFTDVYALGATLYFLLTAKSPPSSPERLYGQSLASIHSLRPMISCTLSDAVTKAMELKESDRLQTIEDFVLGWKARTALTQPQTTTSRSSAQNTPSIVTSPPASNLISSVHPKTTRISAGSSGNTTSVSTVAGLQKAVKKSGPGDTIWLRSGIYRLTETLEINKSIALKGDGGKCRIASVMDGVIVMLRGDCDWLIQDIDFERTSASSSILLMVEGGVIQIKRCSFRGVDQHKTPPSGTGLLIGGISKGLVEQCDFRLHNFGSAFFHQSQIRLTNCNFQLNNFGVAYSHRSTGVLHQSNLLHNTSGVVILEQANPTLINNIISNNNEAISYAESSGGVVQGNTISNNSLGISIQDQANPKMAKNQFLNNADNINDMR